MPVIIVPTDFSEHAFNALRCAVEYFKYEPTTFIVIHVYDDAVLKDESIHSREPAAVVDIKVQQENDLQLRKVKTEIEKYSPNPHHEIHTLSVSGVLTDEINSTAIHHDADLVLMGTQGLTADPERNYGSNTLQVIKYVNCPVLGIPIHYRYHRPEQILFTSKLEQNYQGRELKMLSCLANSYRSTLHLLHISANDVLTSKQQEVKEYWEYRFRESEKIYRHFSSGNVPHIINFYVEEHHIDLVVMLNSSHALIDPLVDATIIDEVGLQAHIPFLILQNLPRQD